MAALLTPLQLQAGSSLLQNQGIELPSGVTTSITNYTSLPLLGNLIATINDSGALPTSTQTLLQTFAGSGGAGNIVITNQGSTYSNANNVPTTGGLGTGLTVNITQTTGIIDTAVINHPGEGYAVSDVVTISGGTATVEVTSLNTSGQAIVATLREGRSKLGLSGSGVGTASNVVPADPNEIPPQAPLIPSIVSESSARAGVVY